MRKFINLENKSLVTIHGVRPGNTVRVEVDEEGTPLDLNWRRRLKDNDGAIVPIKKKKGGK